MMSRPLNADIKRIAQSIIPSLEAVFYDSKSHVEGELVQDIFPGFVKNQLVNCTSAELASGSVSASLRLQYPGLGSCFCMTDASKSTNPISHVSQDFQNVTGYALDESIGRGCNFLQGPVTDPETIRRIQVAMRSQRESVELILNHHKDGEPFWNLLFILPLKDREGRVQNWLGAQVDVSGCMSNPRDFLKVLNGGQSLDTDSVCGSTVLSEQSSSGRDTLREGVLKMSGLSLSRKNSRGSRGSSMNWLFRKQNSSRPASPPAISEVNDAVSTTSKTTKRSQMSPATSVPWNTWPLPRPQILPTAYLNYMLLRCAKGSDSANVMSPGVRKKTSTKFFITNYADAATELLSVNADVSQCSIFGVLSDKANSPSITKSFKTAIRESVDRGEQISMEIQLERTRKRSASTYSNNSRPSPQESESARYEERVEHRPSRASKYERLWTHWTPLKDGNGNVDWVVLLISPGV